VEAMRERGRESLLSLLFSSHLLSSLFPSFFFFFFFLQYNGHSIDWIVLHENLDLGLVTNDGREKRCLYM